MTEDRPIFLGLDLGTSAVKAVLVDADNRIIDSRSTPLSVSRPQQGWSEQDPEAWWQAADLAVRNLATSHPGEMAAVTGIGLSGQMHGLTALDASDAVLRPAILWNDTRSAPQATHLDKDHPAFRQVGGNAVMPGFTAPKAVWMAAAEPELFRQIGTILLPKDYLRLRMTGEKMSDMSDAAGTLWLDVAARDWSDALLEICDLDRGSMPRLVEGSAVSGQLRAEIARQWGIDGRPVVAGGGGDNAAAAVGLGIVAPGDSFLSLGTSGVVFTVTDSFAPAADSGAHAFCHALPRSWHQMGVILAASDCVSWLCDVTGLAVDTLMAQMAQTDLAATDLMFHPYLSGERTPHNDAAARGGFFGLARHHGPGDMARAVLQGVAFAIADATAVLTDAGATQDRLMATGGGANNHNWLSYIASVTGIAIDLPANGDFGAAFGAARLAMLADGARVGDVCHKPATKLTIEPDIALAEKLSPARDDWQQIYQLLKAQKNRHPNG
ncbi:MAG: xylulokinase [Pseudomonadota bacterium]|nr:xylulokinase [Pseudomonadota bacterium]